MTKKVSVRLYERFPQEYAEGGLVQASEVARQHGRWGDDILIHVNPEEFQQMREMWGDPTHNPHTGLPEYGFLSKLWKGIKKVFKAVAPIAINFIPGIGTAVGAGLSALGVSSAALPLATKVVTGALAGGAAGGGKGALAGALTGGVLGGAGSKLASKAGLNGVLGKIAGNAVLSGAANSALGGKFGKGALLGGGLTAALPYLNNALADTSLGKALHLTGGMETLTSPELAPYQPTSGYVPEPGTSAADTYTTYANGTPGAMGSPEDVGGLQEVLVSGQRGEPAVTSGDAAASAVPWISSQAVDQPAAAAAASPTEPDTASTSNGLFEKGSFLDKAFGLMNNTQGLTALTGVIGALNPPEAAQAPAQPDWVTTPLPQYEFNRGRKSMDDIDFYTYGQRPEAAFYNYNGAPVKAADGGLIMGGAGGGRADDIDAKLSGGEYVMDAETVALLGDGSVQEGARKLDEMRQRLRMEKGAAMAQGEISAPAGEPMQYVTGDFAADAANAAAPEGDFSGDMGYDPKGENRDPSAADMARENDASLPMSERYPELSKAQRAKTGKIGRGYPGYENPGPYPGLEGLTRIRAFHEAGGSPRWWDPRSEFEDAVRASDHAVEMSKMHSGPKTRRTPEVKQDSDVLLSSRVLNRKSRKKLGKVLSDINMGME